MSDISFGPGPDAGSITARLRPDAPESAHRLLQQNGGTRGSADGEYVFDGPDAVARAAQAAYLITEARPATVSSREHALSRQLPVDGADVVFARSPIEGIVAATATDATEGLVPDVLRTFGFHHDGSAPDRDFYLPPEGASERQALVAAARASLVLQGLGLQVATVGLATPPAAADRLAEAAEDIALEQVNLRSLTDSRDVADVLDAALDPKTGALPNLVELLDATGEFIARLPPEQGEILGAQVGIARHQASSLTETLATVQAGLAALATAVEAPIATVRSIRATAASTAAARGLPARPVSQAASAAHTPATLPSSAVTL
ncbi:MULTISPECIES: hypothetical protein [unclassified Kitasatospora]|uniref:hypothetical protein n=1 Tax=unclassified Kitasatospora TaxID=2633591 RepID=UPI00070D6301|nr:MULTISPECIES: hypothetical protein [unclassified Kitasatospora]KQV20946.1 hypothetical protein ASC99_20810 [Kitasatospora sp. Root107]KRB60400.1 hypothetical protein ASE03_12370 [Kitasatospora sp. Root187]